MAPFKGDANEWLAMSQSTLTDDELFGEAASELRSDVEEGLEAARSALPDSEAMWSVESDNVLGVMNALRSTLEVEAAREDLRDAKKWYVIGTRADVFEDGDDLAAEIEDLEALFEDIEGVRERLRDLASTLPEIRSRLQALEADAERPADE